MKKREKSVLNFAEAMDCGNISVVFHAWQNSDPEQVLRRLAKIGVRWDGPAHSAERALWLQGKIGPVDVTVFLPLEAKQQLAVA